MPEIRKMVTGHRFRTANHRDMRDHNDRGGEGGNGRQSCRAAEAGKQADSTPPMRAQADNNSGPERQTAGKILWWPWQPHRSGIK